jgi:hypothetical protein
MKKVLSIAGSLALFGMCTCWAQGRMPSKSSETAKNRSAKPALPYGPKDQNPWYKSRAFETTDFQEQSDFEMRRQETEELRQVVQAKQLYGDQAESR